MKRDQDVLDNHFIPLIKIIYVPFQSNFREILVIVWKATSERSRLDMECGLKKNESSVFLKKQRDMFISHTLRIIQEYNSQICTLKIQ